MRLRSKIILAICVSSMGALGGLVGSLGAAGFFRFGDLRHDLPPCFEIGAPFHHRFRAGCEGVLETPSRTLPFRINEDGIRDLPRAEILKWKSRILVIGDSFVEGWWARTDETVSARLHELMPRIYFINGGLRSTGPTFQAKRLRDLLAIYQPLGILWVANDTDGMDERLACAVAKDPQLPLASREFGTPELELGAWQRWIVEALGDSSWGRRARLLFYERRWVELVKSKAATRCERCEGIRQMLLAAGTIPLLPFYLKADAPLTGHYGGGDVYREELANCAKRHGTPFRFVSLNVSERDLARYYWPGDFHLNPEGVLLFVDRIASEVKSWAARLAGIL